MIEEKTDLVENAASRSEEKRRADRATYQPPRIVKKRAVSRATLLTGSGPDAGGIVG